MFVSIEGTGQSGERIERSWHLLAEGNDGPFIPSMALEAIILRSLAGKNPPVGARPATQEIEVADYESLFKNRRIYTGQREAISDAKHIPLYKRILSEAWDTLPPPIAKIHVSAKAEGMAIVERGKNPLARLIAVLFGFPKAGQNVPVRVEFRQERGGELWERDFAGSKFSTFQWEGKGFYDKLLMEKFGPFTFAMALVLEQGKLKLIPRHWNFLGISMPLILAPFGETFEYVENDTFHFSVEMKHIFTGLIVRYQGWLKPVD
jgi:hypothetical protein